MSASGECIGGETMAVANHRMQTAARLLGVTGFASCAVLAGSLAAPAGAADPTLDDLRRQLRESQAQVERRDEVINDLVRRVGELERRAAASAATTVPGVVPPRGPVPASLRAPPQRPAPGRGSLLAQQPGDPGAAPPPPKPGQAPGAIEVDEQAAERALERTLVAGGALLLPFGQAEFEPSFNYTRRDGDVPTLVSVGGDLVGGDQNVKRDEMVPALGLRIGLPWDSQLEFGLPYNVVYEQRTINVGTGSRVTESDTGNSIGDLSIAFAKTVFREKGWRPDLVARVTYDSDTGEKFDNGVSLSGGFNDVRGSLVAVKRQDPLAFVGSLAYQHSFENDDIQPGDQYTLSLGTVLALSPQTSLRFSLQQQFVDSVELNGQEINNTDQRVANAQIGLSTSLARGLLFDIVGGIGLTEDSPDYFFGMSLPYRFSIPVPQSVMP